MKILLLGVGLQGKAALHDLVTSPDVTHVIAADVDIIGLRTYVEQLQTEKVECAHLDATDHTRVAEMMQAVDAVIVLLPRTFRAPMARLAVANNIHFVDASYTHPDYHAIAAEAASKNLAILPEFGLDPGIDLVLAAQLLPGFDEIHDFRAYGTGVPVPEVANNPLKYKISWSFESVLNAYCRPSRFVAGGQVRDIASDQIFAPEYIHEVEVNGLGAFEAYYNGDAVKYLKMLGLTGRIQAAGRYTMRWPGHAAIWKTLGDLGFLEQTPLNGDQSNGCQLTPRQFLHDLLVPQLQFQPDEKDVVVVRVEVIGRKNGRPHHAVAQVIDYRDLTTGLLGMQRTVGYTASIGAQMILRGDIQKRGLLSPLTDIPGEKFFAELRKRNIQVETWEE